MDITNSTDSKLVANIKERSCNDSLKELIRRHAPLCSKIYQKYTSVLLTMGYPIEDIVNEKDLVIYNAAMKFLPDKDVKFSTWVGNQIRYQCLNMINKRKGIILASDEELKFLPDQGYHDKNNDDVNYMLSIVGQFDDPRMKDVYLLRYFEDPKINMTWHNVAKKLQISTQTAINLHNKGKKVLKQKLNSKVLFDKI